MRLDLLLLLRLNLHRIWPLPAPLPLLPPSIEAISADRDKLMCSGFLTRKKNNNNTKNLFRFAERGASMELSTASAQSRCYPPVLTASPLGKNCSLTASLNAASHSHLTRVKAVRSVPKRFQFFCFSAIDFFFFGDFSATQSHRSAAEYANYNQS